jgi:hypothetical protein
MGYETKGHNIRTVQRWARIWEIPTDHFDPNVARRRATTRRAMPLETIMVENSTYSRGKLKKRLLRAGLMRPICELCGQGEI